MLQNGQPIGFASRSMTSAEKRYAQIEKECLAIVFSCEKFVQYVYGRIVTVHTDHKPLETISKEPLCSAPKRLKRKLLRLQKFTLVVKHNKEMYVSEFLSRALLPCCNSSVELPNFPIFVVCQQEALFNEFENIDLVCDLSVTDRHLKQIKTETAVDESLQCHLKVVRGGWPDHKSATPLSIREYWPFRDEITMQDSIVFKAYSVIIPKSMRKEMLNRIHSSHQGAEACLQKAKEILFWPNMKHEVRDAISMCSVCNEYLAAQQKEPLIPVEIPMRPWSMLAIDLFVFNDKNYVILVDYYSDYWELTELHQTSATKVINLCKELLSRHGICDILISGNASQSLSAEFARFAVEWEFQHSASSPYHSQSNGKAESAVKIAKRLLTKAFRDGSDPFIAILEWRNTPTGLNSSPVQRLMSRRMKTLLPTSACFLLPQVARGVVKDKRK